MYKYSGTLSLFRSVKLGEMNLNWENTPLNLLTKLKYIRIVEDLFVYINKEKVDMSKLSIDQLELIRIINNGI